MQLEGKLIAYEEEAHLLFDEQETTRLIDAIDNVKILDPACGSGAFPMGMLHKLVFILSRLDPRNEKWKATQIARASEFPDPEAREKLIAAMERAFNENTAVSFTSSKTAFMGWTSNPSLCRSPSCGSLFRWSWINE